MNVREKRSKLTVLSRMPNCETSFRSFAGSICSPLTYSSAFRFILLAFNLARNGHNFIFTIENSSTKNSLLALSKMTTSDQWCIDELIGVYMQLCIGEIEWCEHAHCLKLGGSYMPDTHVYPPLTSVCDRCQLWMLSAHHMRVWQSWQCGGWWTSSKDAW